MKEFIVSLTSFLEMSDVAARLKSLRPKVPRKLDAPLRVEPRSNRYTMVGTAFDYLLRFELQRRAPHAVSRKWMAESTPDLLWPKGDDGMAVMRDELCAACQLPPEEAGGQLFIFAGMPASGYWT